MNENHDQPPRLGLGVDELWEMADQAGIERSTDESALLAFALSIAENCAEIGDRYTVAGRNCGDEIRSRFGLG